MNLRLLLAAEQELIDAALFYESQAPQLGQDFLDRVERVFHEISANPERYPMVGFGIRRRNLLRFPYAILFRVEPEEIVILAVMHQKRRPGYWKPRLSLKP